MSKICRVGLYTELLYVIPCFMLLLYPYILLHFYMFLVLFMSLFRGFLSRCMQYGLRNH